MVIVCRHRRAYLAADDQGVRVRNYHGRSRSCAWPEISGFADGSLKAEGGPRWALEIVLDTGEKLHVSAARRPDPDTQTAIRQVAERYGIRADLAGIPASKGLPVGSGFYEDPGGQAGVRYWDGTQWSPLLEPGSARLRVNKSAAYWAALPVAAEPWAYPAAEVALCTRWWRIWGIATAALVVPGIVAGIWWRWYDAAVWFLFAGIPGLFLWGSWIARREAQKLQKLWLTKSTGHMS
jgi:Protein of unknown function (DUF2510)/Bacterial PH domain